MSTKSNFLHIHIQSPLTPPHRTIAILPTRSSYRLWRRRRLKSNRTLSIRNQLGSSPLDNLFRNLVSDVPSFNSLELLAPALGFASGLALYLSRLNFTSNLNSQVSDLGEWILFTSPTPFNRFVMLRCPSISFQGSELLEDVNEKLVKEDRHFVRVDSGRIQVRESDEKGRLLEEKLVYQRVCVSTDDGGVISLDWPANLDLSGEQGLDTTLLLIPGTSEGSMDKNIRSFVCDCLKRGCFPVVMNPRGCAGSPLTTARLFTAADSDDICTAIQFISRARPWTTLMGVGWGYGANMLTKYLAEAGEKTPLIAATCIDNPFDLEEATRSSPYHLAFNQKLTGGLIDILRSNKELFQGRAKGYDVEKALLATSVRDFEKSISMVPYGFDAIEDFYAKSSTRDVVGNVKIPLLFIQNDDGTVPLFSIPRSSIAENPFTSLLLCSGLPSGLITSGRSTIPWCEHITIEWLAAVEFGLLKGRHPLLKDVDVTINPSKGLALLGGNASTKSDRVNKLLNLPHLDALNGNSLCSLKEMLEESDTAASSCFSSKRDSRRNLEKEVEGSQQDSYGALQQTSSVDAELVKEEVVGPVDDERGEVLQTAQVVMNMLDVTMPDNLTEEQKKKVLTAVGQGETLMKALQDAVPEDVREKLTAAVSGIVRNQRSNLKLDGLLSVSQIPEVASELKSKIQEKVEGLSNADSGKEDPYSSDQRKRVDDLADGSNKNQPTRDISGGPESEPQASENLRKSVDTGQFQLTSNHGSDISGSGKNSTNELGHNNENADFSRDKAAQYSDYKENGSETDSKADSFCQSERAGGTEDVIIDQYKVEQDGPIAQSDMKEDDAVQQNEENFAESSTDQNKRTSSTKTEERASVSSSETQGMENEGSDNQKKEEISTQPVLNQNSSNPPTFSVSQALDALVGIDDSTQVAVNSVFNVIEDMITQFEVDRDDEIEVKDKNGDKDRRSGFASENHHIINDKKFEKKEDCNDDMSLQVYKSDDIPSYNRVDSKNDARVSWVEEKAIQNPILFRGKIIDNSRVNNLGSHLGEENEKGEYLVGNKLSPKTSDKLLLLNNILHKVPPCLTTNPYGNCLYREYLRKYLISKMKNTKSLDLNTTTALFLDYFPEEGQWKLLEQTGNGKASIGYVTTHEGVDRNAQSHLPLKVEYTDKIIEPSYVILDAEKQQEPVGEYEKMNKTNEKVEICDDTSEETMLLVKNIILDSLKVEVGRRLSATDTEEMEPNLARDLHHVANAVSLALGHGKDNVMFMEGKDHFSEKVGTINGNHIIRAISSAVQETSYLRRVLPVGVVVGSSLADLRKFFNVDAASGDCQNEAATHQLSCSGERNCVQAGEMETVMMPSEKINQKYGLESSISRYGEKAESNDINNKSVMVGAITAALGASALLVHQQDSYKGNEIAGIASKSFKEAENHQEPGKFGEEMSEKNQNNIVTSLAEKAMSVAGPVVPTKQDGEVDQERLVAMLTELGQKGGMLKLVGKIALLWGGLRGAMSLTDKLISFLRIAERPLLQRILGFVCMVVVLWTPVVVPLLPTLVRSWATHNSSKIAELACIIGLYISIMILVTLWGKRIRGYENPLEQYGLDLTSSTKILNFLKGLIGGVMLVLLIHSVNALLGCVHLSWPSNASSSLDAVTWIKVYGQMLVLSVRGLATATGVALVEELLFRSWLPDEIAADIGYHRGIIISGLAFSLLQRSPWAIPGLWLLSLALAGARQRYQGSLFLPIGLRAGIMASSFILQMGGFLTYQPNFPLWLTGTQPFQPFSGIVGVAFALSLAIVLYPVQPPLHRKKITRTIRE